MLSATKSIYDHWEEVNIEAMNNTLANRKATELIHNIFSKVTSIGSGKLQKLFASAITPDGPLNYLQTLIAPAANKYIITGDPGTGRSTLLNKVVQTAISKGFDVEAFYCPLAPDKLEHVLIPGLETAITTSFTPHLYNDTTGEFYVNMNEYRYPEIVNKHVIEAVDSKLIFEKLLEKSIFFINKAKVNHNLTETYYVSNINFSGQFRT